MEQLILNTHGARMGKLISGSRMVEMVLFAGDLFKLDGDPRHMSIECLSGRLWVTQAGDPLDYLLSAGESVVIRGAGQVLVQGQPEARFVINPPLLSLN